MIKVTCPRCNGSGHYSYHMTKGTVCFKCNGSGYLLMNGKKKVKASHTLDTCSVGDTIEMGGHICIVTSIKWVQDKRSLGILDDKYNQVVRYTRVITNEPKKCWRTVYNKIPMMAYDGVNKCEVETFQRQTIEVTDDMVGQEVE